MHLFMQAFDQDLEFISTLYELTTCKTNGSASCAVVILYSSTLSTISEAFVSCVYILHCKLENPIQSRYVS